MSSFTLTNQMRNVAMKDKKTDECSIGELNFIDQLKSIEKLDLVALISKIPVPIAVLQVDGVFIGVNQTFADIYDSDALYLVGKKLNFISNSVFHLFHKASLAFKEDSKLSNLDNEFYAKGHFFQIYFKSIRDQINVLHSIIVVCVDITKIKRRERVLIQANKKLYEQLYLDPVTGLGNRIALSKFLEEKAVQVEESNLSFIKFEIDDFKKFNQLNNYSVGDDVLLKIGKLLVQELKSDCAEIYRLNAASFVLVIENSTSWKVLTIAERLRQSLKKEGIELGGNTNEVLTCAIGVYHPHHHHQLDEQMILEKLDVAVNRSISQAKNSIYVLEGND